MEQKLLSFSEHITFAYIAMWLIYLIVYRRLDSKVIALTSVVFFSLLMNYITPYVLAYAKNNAGILPKAVFHLTFCAIQLVAVFSIRLLHDYFRLKMSKAALAVIILYILQVSIHLIYLAEKAVLGTFSLSYIYTISINTVNVLLCFVCVLCILQFKVSTSTKGEYL
ncbi:hypothetical protein [Pseudoalteromonas sp. Of7M-16]|uniref:hypothetical protein n=1 Tax=Pseudoalteromonas sp. Of7M-16 TaxID=2917756 RepID=UPI001EF3DC8F|nr:hypothetical protein [Pseudoalteromonas sp. Of7M-16]MCG7546972.1 hypothetical protein [Pseudoalteromonas sp. Of7M-16]